MSDLRKLLLIFLILTATASAEAGKLGDFCSNVFDFFVQADPYQYESASTKWVQDQIERYEMKERWQTIDRQELEDLNILRNELTRRARIAEVIRVANEKAAKGQQP